MSEPTPAKRIFSIAIVVTVRSSTLNSEYPILINTLDAEEARSLLAALARAQFEDTPQILLARCGAENLRALADDWEFVDAAVASPALDRRLRATLTRSAIEDDTQEFEFAPSSSDSDGE